MQKIPFAIYSCKENQKFAHIRIKENRKCNRFKKTANKNLHEKTTFVIYDYKENQKFEHLGLKENKKYNNFKKTANKNLHQENNFYNIRL